MPLANRFSNLRPLSEFFDFKRISKPQNFGEAQSRMGYNISYFSSNYAVVIALLSIYSLLTNMLLLFVILMVVGGMWGIGRLGGADLEVGELSLEPENTRVPIYDGPLEGRIGGKNVMADNFGLDEQDRSKRPPLSSTAHFSELASSLGSLRPRSARFSG